MDSVRDLKEEVSKWKRKRKRNKLLKVELSSIGKVNRDLFSSRITRTLSNGHNKKLRSWRIGGSLLFYRKCIILKEENFGDLKGELCGSIKGIVIPKFFIIMPIIERI